jgi:dUTP pyrophosphatase
MIEKLKIPIKNTSKNSLPEYATTGSAGMDLRANLEATLQLKPFERKLVPTGIFMEIPDGFEGQVRPRSGLAVKYGITCLNTPGTIDSDYRGELKVLLINLGEEIAEINNNDRIAQLVICPVTIADLHEVAELENTTRGEGGFGHTGK